MALRLTLLQQPMVPVEVPGIVPQRLQSLTLDEIRRLPISYGNQSVKLAELFSVAGDPSDGCVEWFGDCHRVHWIGAGQSLGETIVRGSVGRHLGSEMNGGTIDVWGSADLWAGAHQAGGLIHIRGHAGDRAGAAYHRSPQGMTGGVLLIDGSAGNQVGSHMRRGLIAIGQDCGQLLGCNMFAGTIVVLGEVGLRPGAGMRRGTILLGGPRPPELLPTFRRAARMRFTTGRLIFRELSRAGFAVPEDLFRGLFEIYHGDFLQGGRGEIWCRQTRASTVE